MICLLKWILQRFFLILTKVDFTKILSDNLALSDDLLTKVDFTKILSDNLALSDFINVSVQRGAGNTMLLSYNF